MSGYMEYDARSIDEMAAHALPKAPEPNTAAAQAVGYAIVGMTLAYFLHRFGLPAHISEAVGLAAVWAAARYDCNLGWRKYSRARQEAWATLRRQAEPGSD